MHPGADIAAAAATALASPPHPASEPELYAAAAAAAAAAAGNTQQAAAGVAVPGLSCLIALCKKLQQPLFKRWLHAHRGVSLALVRVGLALVQALDRPPRCVGHQRQTNAKPTRTNANGES
jgi:hypothetical protein